MRKLLNSQNDFEDFTIDDHEENDDDKEKLISLPHSFSEESIPKDAIPDAENMAFGRRSSTPVTTDEVQSNPQTPKEKRRGFSFGFLNKTPTTGTETSTSVTETPPKTSTPVTTGATTPTKSSLRSRMMEKFMGKSPNAQSTPIPIEEPEITEVKANESYSPINESPLDNQLSRSLSVDQDHIDQHPDSDIETAVEAHEYEFDKNESDTLTNQIVEDVIEEHVEIPQPLLVTVQGYWWSLGLPLCFLLFLQLLPFPSWVVGFVTGILLAVPIACYATYKFMDDNSPCTPFMENINQKKAVRPAIIVQEELKRIHVSLLLFYVKIDVTKRNFISQFF